MLPIFLLAALLVAYGLLLIVLMVDAACLSNEVDRLAELVYDCRDDNARARADAALRDEEIERLGKRISDANSNIFGLRKSDGVNGGRHREHLNRLDGLSAALARIEPRVVTLEEKWAESGPHCDQVAAAYHVMADALGTAAGTARALGMRYEGDDIADLADLDALDDEA